MRVTLEVLSRIERLRAEGKSYKEITKCTGLSKGTLSLYLSGKPHGTAIISKKLSPEMIDKVHQLRHENKTQEHIAKELGISQACVHRYTKGIKVQLPKKLTRADSPYIDYLIYGPYYCKSAKRNKIILINEKDNSKLQMTWARYMMSIKINQVLDSEEHVDHIDDNSTNDILENLQILNHSDHAKKTLIDKAVTKTIVTIQCPECNTIFEREKNHTHLINKRFMRTFCSRRCAAKYYKRDGPKIDPQSTIVSTTQIPVFLDGVVK